MKKGKKLPMMAAVLAVIIAVVLGYFLYSAQPFETLEADEIAEIRVYAIPPDAEVVLSETEIENAVSLLQDLKVSKPGYGMFAIGLGGQTVKITVQMTDRTAVEISNIGNVIITIDNKSYRADYATAEAINQFANKVLNTGF